MKSTKEDTVKEPSIDLRKPIVQEFVDQDKQMTDFLLTRLPHVSHARPKFICVYRSKDNSIYRHRVNWYREIQDDKIDFSVNKIVASQYVEVKITKDGIVLTDLTK
jgi:hypothetical protein